MVSCKFPASFFLTPFRLGVAATLLIGQTNRGFAQNDLLRAKLTRNCHGFGKASLTKPAAALDLSAASLPDESLPDEPEPAKGFSASADSSIAGPSKYPVVAKRIAPVFHRYIEPGEVAQRLTLPQQLVFGFAQSISPYFLLTVAGAAGYEQAVNGAPNYGSNFDAFGRRVGAAAIRNTSQSFFADSLMAPLLHEDPRFYVMGVRRSVLTRATYAASRVFVTRNADDGHLTPNYAQLSGYAEAAILTDAYYPAVNVHVRRTLSSYGVSLGGSAISNVVREFYPSLRDIARRTKPE